MCVQTKPGDAGERQSKAIFGTNFDMRDDYGTELSQSGVGEESAPLLLIAEFWRASII